MTHSHPLLLPAFRLMSETLVLVQVPVTPPPHHNRPLATLASLPPQAADQILHHLQVQAPAQWMRLH